MARHTASRGRTPDRRRPSPQRARGLERRVRAAHDVALDAPRAASTIACAMPRRREAPVRHHAEPAQARAGRRRRRPRDRARRAARAAPGAAAAPPTFAPRRDDVAASRIAPSSACETPSISFSATLPVKPSVTTTSAVAGGEVRRPRRCRRSRTRALGRRARAARVRLDHERRALRRPPRRSDSSADARALDAEHDLRERGAHEARTGRGAPARTSTLAPTSSSVTGRPGTGHGHGERRAVDARGRA